MLVFDPFELVGIGQQYVGQECLFAGQDGNRDGREGLREEPVVPLYHPSLLPDPPYSFPHFSRHLREPLLHLAFHLLPLLF